MIQKKKRNTHILKELALFIVLFFMIPVNKANASDKDGKLTNHVIIAFDDAFSSDRFKKILMYDGISFDYKKSRYHDRNNKVDWYVENEQIDSLKGLVSGAIRKIIDECELLQEGDYFSIVGFCMGTGNSSFEEFVKPSELQGYYENGGIAAWCPFNDIDALFPKNQKDWQKVVFDDGYNRAIPSEKDKNDNKPYRYSLLMGAKQYAVKLLRTNENRTNRVYLLMVTDDQYNGNDDFYSEINNLNNPYVSKDRFIEDCREVAIYYRYEVVKEEIISEREYENGKDYKVMLLEVVPCFSTSLNSVIDFPANFGLHRKKGGYNLCFDYEGVDSMFQLEKLSLTVRKDGEVICSKTNGKGNGSFDLELSDVYPGDHISIDMSCWLSMKDPVYNGILMSPSDERCSRLNLSREVELTDYASVFGWPLKESFWWFNYDDSVKAALRWQRIIVVIGTFLLTGLVIFIGVLLVKRASRFIPDDNEIKINNLN